MVTSIFKSDCILISFFIVIQVTVVLAEDFMLVDAKNKTIKDGWVKVSVKEIQIFKEQLERFIARWKPFVKNKNSEKILLEDGYLLSNLQVQRLERKRKRTKKDFLQTNDPEKMLLLKKGTLWSRERSVCFGAESNSFGTLTFKKNGKLQGVKLVHKSGNFNCGYSTRYFWSCREDEVAVGLTNDKNTLICPEQLSKQGAIINTMFEGNSTKILIAAQVEVKKGDEARLWFGPALVGNVLYKGRSCADVSVAIQTQKKIKKNEEKEERTEPENVEIKIILVILGVICFVASLSLIYLCRRQSITMRCIPYLCKDEIDMENGTTEDKQTQKLSKSKFYINGSSQTNDGEPLYAQVQKAGPKPNISMPYEPKVRDEAEEKEIENDETKIHLIPSAEVNSKSQNTMIVYSELGIGGRQGARSEPYKPTYATAKIDGIEYPPLMSPNEKSCF